MNRDVNYLRSEVFAESSEDWNDVYLKIKDIRKGDVFYECEQGVNYKLVATTNARRISDGWYCNVKNSDGESFEFFVSDNTNHPGPNLFREPQYITKYNEKLVYLLD